MANGQNARIFTDIASAVTAAIVRAPNVPVNVSQAPAVERVVKEAVASDPVVQNKLNAEAPYQSRITVGNVVALLAIIANYFGVDIAPDDQAAMLELWTLIVAVWGVGYALYGRWWPRLRPLFSRKT